MNARVADQVVVELRMLVDQHIRAGRRAREEFEHNIGGMASVAERSTAKQVQALDRAAVAAERAEQRKAKAAERAIAAQARADDKRARLVIQAQRGTAAATEAQEKAAAKIQTAQAKAAAAADRAAAKAQAAAAKEAAQAERAAARIAKARAREEAAAAKATAAAEKAAAKKIAADAKAAAKAQQTADRAAAAQIKAAERLAAAEARENQRKSAFVIRGQRAAAELQARQARDAAAVEKAAQRQAQQDARAEQRRAAMILRAQRGLATAAAAEERAAAREQAARNRAAAAAERAAARKAAADARAAASAERSAQRQVAAIERTRAAEIASRSRSIARQQAAGSAASSRLLGGVSSLAMGGAIGGVAVGAGATALAGYADAWAKVGNRVAAAGVPLSQVAAKQEELYQLAQKTRSPLEATADLYQRLKIATSDLGTSETDVLRLTETITKSFKASGASTAEFQGSVIQLGQALSSGVLQGEELRSLREQAPALARAIAKEFDTTVGGLKKLGEEGKLTSDRVIKALLSVSDQADKTFSKLKATFADSLTALGNGVTRYAGKVNEAAGSSKAFGDAIGGALSYLEDPAVIQAGVDVVTLLAQALQAAAGALAFVARNFVILKAAGAAFIAIKLVSFIRDLVSALTALRIAALANPFTAILAVAATVIVILADVVGSVDSVGEAFDRLNAKINGIAASVRRELQNAANAAAEVASRLIPGVSEQADALESDLRSIADEQADLERQSDELTATLEDLLPDVDADSLIAQAQGIRREFDQGKISAQEAADKIRALTATWNSPEAPGILAKIAAIIDKLIDLDTKAIAARNSLDDVLNRPFATTPSFGFIKFTETPTTPTAPVPGVRPDPPVRPRHLSGGGGSGKKAKQAKDPTLAPYLEELKAEVAQLALNGIALKENELRTQALAKAKQDFENKLRKSADLLPEESAQITAAARQMEGIPAILQLAADKLPEFSLAQQLKDLEALKALLTDPAIVAALQAQGLSAADAAKAIEIQIASAKDTANGTTEAIQGIGEALQSGIQGAQTFEDALLKVGVALLQMLAQAAAFGGSGAGGPLGKIFDTITGLTGGLAGLAGGGSSPAGLNLSGPVPSQSTLPKLAGGGQALPGRIYEVGETGREWFAPQVPGQVIPNSVIKNAAGGGGGGGPPIQFNISLAGANGDRAIAEISAAAVKRGLSQVPNINRQHRIRFSQ